MLDFFSTTDVEKLVPAEEDARCEVSEWELQVRREREEERRLEAEGLGSGEELPLSGLPMPSFMASVGEEYGTDVFPSVLSFRSRSPMSFPL